MSSIADAQAPTALIPNFLTSPTHLNFIPFSL